MFHVLSFFILDPAPEYCELGRQIDKPSISKRIVTLTLHEEISMKSNFKKTFIYIYIFWFIPCNIIKTNQNIVGVFKKKLKYLFTSYSCFDLDNKKKKLESFQSHFK